MMDFHTTAVFFSPTGGTRRALECFLNQWDPQAVRVDATCPPARLEPVSLGAGDVLVLAFPVYAGRVPAVPGLFENLHGENTPCILLACYGNRHYDDALAQLAFQLEGQGFVCVGAAACITPHTFAPGLGAGRPDALDTEALARLAETVRGRLTAGQVHSVQLPGEKTPVPKPAKPVPKTRDENKCNRCGACVRACPAQAIGPDLHVDECKCIHCMHCVAVCPAGAIQCDTSVLEACLTEHFSSRREVELFL